MSESIGGPVEHLREPIGEHEERARRLMAVVLAADPQLWSVVDTAEFGVWYDWADPSTGKFGQCCAMPDGWKQAPLGTNPVVLGLKTLNLRHTAALSRSAPDQSTDDHPAAPDRYVRCSECEACRDFKCALAPPVYAGVDRDGYHVWMQPWVGNSGGCMQGIRRS